MTAVPHITRRRKLRLGEAACLPVEKSGPGLAPGVALSVWPCLSSSFHHRRPTGLIFRVFCASWGECFRFWFAFCSFVIRFFFPFPSPRKRDEWTQIGSLKSRGEFRFPHRRLNDLAQLTAPSGPVPSLSDEVVGLHRQVHSSAEYLPFSLLFRPPISFPSFSSRPLAGPWALPPPCL